MERQDIDALLIGALYGELTPADEARLTAHLESHPTDRGALDDLKVTRQAVLESRIFAVQTEPPQAISALLLQEAHHRAPKRAAIATDEQRESWFYRFTRVFLAHPAMAAAAMLVLVLGGAALMHSNNNGAAATKELDQAPSATTVATQANGTNAETAVTTPAAPAAGSGSAAGSAYSADLYDGEGGEPRATGPAQGAADQGDRADKAPARKDIADEQTDKKASHSIAVGTNKGSVKELDRGKADDDFGMLGGDTGGAPAGAAGGGGGGAGAGAATITGQAIGRGGVKGGGYAQPPPPANSPKSNAAPAPATGGVLAAPTSPPMAEPRPDTKAPAKVASTATKASPKADAPADAVKQEAKPADSSLIAWAKGEHARAVTLAQRGDCTSAAKVALSVSSRASDYYAQYMATDRALKQCAQYINAEREKDAEKSAKSRAQKRTNSEEPAPANIGK